MIYLSKKPNPVDCSVILNPFCSKMEYKLTTVVIRGVYKNTSGKNTLLCYFIN